MLKITRLEFWKLEGNIVHNRHLNIVGDLWYSADVKGVRYADKNNVTIAKSSKEGYFVDERLVELTK